MKAAISRSSQKQRTVVLSSCEAEIVALSETAKDAIYVHGILGKLKGLPKETAAVITNNKVAHDLSQNPKHVKQRHLFKCVELEDIKLSVPLVKTTENPADFFTKLLPSKTFFTLRNAIINIKGDHCSARHNCAKSNCRSIARGGVKIRRR